MTRTIYFNIVSRKFEGCDNYTYDVASVFDLVTRSKIYIRYSQESKIGKILGNQYFEDTYYAVDVDQRWLTWRNKTVYDRARHANTENIEKIKQIIPEEFL